MESLFAELAGAPLERRTPVDAGDEVDNRVRTFRSGLAGQIERSDEVVELDRPLLR